MRQTIVLRVPHYKSKLRLKILNNHFYNKTKGFILHLQQAEKIQKTAGHIHPQTVYVSMHTLENICQNYAK